MNLSVFGYGSIMWRPGFDFELSEMGYIRGYSRRFYQKSTYHRGTVENPGLVLTLVEEDNSRTYGVAYRIQENVSDVLKLLREREVGYEEVELDFYPIRTDNTASYKVKTFVALPSNDMFCVQNDDEIAKQIVKAKGECGSNLEYFEKFFEYLSEHFSEVPESLLLNEHLNQLNTGIAT